MIPHDASHVESPICIVAIILHVQMYKFFKQVRTISYLIPHDDQNDLLMYITMDVNQIESFLFFGTREASVTRQVAKVMI